MQAGSTFPHSNDILYTQSQAAEFAGMGVPVASHSISSAPAWKEQIDSNGRAVNVGIMNGRLWQQHTDPANCDVATDANCKYMVPYFYADGTTTAVRANIETAMAAIEAKTCLSFQYLSNPRSFQYVNKKKLRVVTNLNICSSYVGANLIEQDIYLSHHAAMDCGLNSRAVEHEILHAVGLYHENQRYDYADWIDYEWANLDATMSNAQINSDYGVIPEEMSNTFDSMYDVNSVMHLLSDTNREGGPCLSTNTSPDCTDCGNDLTKCVLMASILGGGHAPITADTIGEPENPDRGYRKGSLTDEDAWQINNMYGCTAYLDKYMFTCSADASDDGNGNDTRATGFAKHVMSHHSGVDGVCDGDSSDLAICGTYNDGSSATAADGLDEDDTETCGKCQRGNHDCAANATCINDQVAPTTGATDCTCDVSDLDWNGPNDPTPGWGSTVAVNTAAYKGNGFSDKSGGSGCTDNNECIDAQSCYDQNADVRLQCINLDGGYECVCPPGQTHPPENKSNPLQHLTLCVDLDECATEQHGCPSHMQCINRYCEAGLRNGNGSDANGESDAVGYGDPCHYGETNVLKSYECGCQDQTGNFATTGTYGSCDNVNQCAGTDFAQGSNVFGTDVCKMCLNGQMHGDCPAGQDFDAGLMCFDTDDATTANGYECRCPLGAEMQYYTPAFFAELDESNDNQVNGDIISIVNTQAVLPMAGWVLVDRSVDGIAGVSGASFGAVASTSTQLAALDFDARSEAASSSNLATKRENGDIQILIPKSFHGDDASGLDAQAQVTAGTEGNFYFMVTWDDTTKEWTSDWPAQCVDIDMCPRTKCPGKDRK